MFKKILATLVMAHAAWAFAAVDANKGSAADLIEIKGIGPATAERIIDARKQGNFKNWDDFIARTKGVAATSAGKMSDAGLTVNGQSYKPGASTKPTSPQSVDKTTKPAQTTGKSKEKS